MSTRRDRAARVLALWMRGLDVRDLYRLTDMVLAEIDRVPDISELVYPQTTDGGAASPPADQTGQQVSQHLGSGAAAERATAKAASPSVLPRPFLLFRIRDVSGTSGTGVVAWGTQFPDGAAALRWNGPHPSTAAWPSVEDIVAVHGHQGATVIHWVDGGK